MTKCSNLRCGRRLRRHETWNIVHGRPICVPCYASWVINGRKGKPWEAKPKKMGEIRAISRAQKEGRK